MYVHIVVILNVNDEVFTMKADYKIYSDSTITVVASAKYHGTDIEAKAKCHPEDRFDEKFGKNLAYNRLQVKFLKAKRKHAKEVQEKAFKEYTAAMKKLMDADYFDADVEYQYNIAKHRLEAIEAIIKK